MSKILFIFLLLFLSACKYTVPLAGKSELVIDHRVLGQWRQISGNDRHVMVLPYTDKKYLVVYQTDDQALYFRGYPIKFNVESYVQLQFIGTSEKVIADENQKYDVLRYDIKEDKLTVALLNDEVIGKDMKTGEALREAFRQQAGNERLFRKFGDFERTE